MAKNRHVVAGLRYPRFHNEERRCLLSPHGCYYLQLQHRRRTGLCRRHTPWLRPDRHVDSLYARREHLRHYPNAALAVGEVADERSYLRTDKKNYD